MADKEVRNYKQKMIKQSLKAQKSDSSLVRMLQNKMEHSKTEKAI